MLRAGLRRWPILMGLTVGWGVARNNTMEAISQIPAAAWGQTSDAKKQEINEREIAATDLWPGHFVARRSQSAAAMLPPHAAWPAQTSGCAIRVYL